MTAAETAERCTNELSCIGSCNAGLCTGQVEQHSNARTSISECNFCGFDMVPVALLRTPTNNCSQLHVCMLLPACRCLMVMGAGLCPLTAPLVLRLSCTSCVSGTADQKESAPYQSSACTPGTQSFDQVSLERLQQPCQHGMKQQHPYNELTA